MTPRGCSAHGAVTAVLCFESRDEGFEASRRHPMRTIRWAGSMAKSREERESSSISRSDFGRVVTWRVSQLVTLKFSGRPGR
jgi:hypothetical protein